VRDFFDGYNVTIMACERSWTQARSIRYSPCGVADGQTGSGKTYTQMGPASGDYGERGLCARIIAQVYSEARGRMEGGKQEVIIQASALEIYNEHIYDLLADEDDAPPDELAIYEAADGTTFVHVSPIGCIRSRALLRP
jgi:hypothetical protein